MDPISIATGSASLAVFCVKVASAVYTLTDNIRNVDANVSGLHQELIGFSGTLVAIEKTWKQNSVTLLAYSGPDAALWNSVSENLDNSRLTLDLLEKSLTKVKKGGIFGQGILKKPTKALKLNLSITDITTYQHRISSHHIAMQGGLQMISLCLHIQGNSSLQSLDSSLASLEDQIKLINQRAEIAVKEIKDSRPGPSQEQDPQEEEDRDRVASGLRSMAKAAGVMFSNASTVIDGRRSTVYGGSVIGENDGPRMWEGSVLGTPLTEEQYSGIENWIPTPAEAKEEEAQLVTNNTAPKTDFLTRAIDTVKKAIAFDNARDYEQAYKQYYIALELFMVAIKFEKNFESKRLMQNKAAEYMDRAEKLKTYLQNTKAPAKNTTPTNQGIPIRKEVPAPSRSPVNPGIPLVLPPNISTKRFDEYITQAEDICGAANVEIITKANGTYKNMLDALDMLNLNISDKDNFLMSAVVSPRKATEAQDIVRLCNTFDIPIWSFSSGTDGDYRAAIPRVPGSIGLDFGRHMNKVLGVNESSAYVVVEPGVTYTTIYQYLVNNKLDQRFEICLSEQTGEMALANLVDGNVFRLHCGKEVILPGGDLIRTGKVDLPSIQPTAAGSTQDQQSETKGKEACFSSEIYKGGILAQDSLGIAVKLAISLTPYRGGGEPYLITFPRDGDLARVIGIVQKLRNLMVFQTSPTVHHVLSDAAILGPKSSYASSNTPLSDTELDNIASNLKVGRWNLYGVMYGPGHVTSSLWMMIKEGFREIEGARFYTEPVFPGDQKKWAFHTRTKTLHGIPTPEEAEWTKWIPNGSHVFFRLTSDVSGEIAAAQYDITRKRIQDAGFDFMGSFTIDTHQMHNMLYIVYERYDADSRARVHKLIRTLMDDCAQNGWTEYMTHVALMDQIVASRNIKCGDLERINGEVKDLLDPKGIMEPGRNGIWPKNADRHVWQRMAERSVAR